MQDVTREVQMKRHVSRHLFDWSTI